MEFVALLFVSAVGVTLVFIFTLFEAIDVLLSDRILVCRSAYWTGCLCKSSAFLKVNGADFGVDGCSFALAGCLFGLTVLTLPAFVNIIGVGSGVTECSFAIPGCTMLVLCLFLLGLSVLASLSFCSAGMGVGAGSSYALGF